MIEIAIPGFAELRLANLVCDYNGTLARDGRLLEDLRARLTRLAEVLRVQIVTGDTFGTAREQLAGLPCEVLVLPAEDQAHAKLTLVRQLGPEGVVAIGNGRNDRLMLNEARLGIAVLGAEGAAAEGLSASDVVVRHAGDALDLLIHARRLVATLRS
jgi:P-type E1-E2 ATPase